MLEVLASNPVTVKAGQTAIIKIPFKGKPVPRVTWYKDGIEVTGDARITLEREADSTTLVLAKCMREDSGAIMLRLKSDCGTAIANMHLNVLGKWRTSTQPNGCITSGAAVHLASQEQFVPVYYC